MQDFIEVKSVNSEEFKTCKVVLIKVEDSKGNYVISPNRIAFPWSTIDGENLEVEIVKCKVGKKLKFKMLVGGAALAVHETLTVISSIRIDK